jgi:hypothetical protein
MVKDSAKNGISGFGGTSWQYRAAIKELAKASQTGTASVDEQGLRSEYTSFTGRVFFPGSPEEIEYAKLRGPKSGTRKDRLLLAAGKGRRRSIPPRGDASLSP